MLGQPKAEAHWRDPVFHTEDDLRQVLSILYFNTLVAK